MTQQTPPEEVARIFDAEVRDHETEAFQPSWNVAPTDPLTVVLQREDGRTVERPRWGLIPSWAKSSREGARFINARAETVATSPAFRVAFGKRRCIVPSDGFYEWQQTGGKRKQPFFLGPVADRGAVLAMAGLWSVWKDPATGLWVTSAAVITTPTATCAWCTTGCRCCCLERPGRPGSIRTNGTRTCSDRCSAPLPTASWTSILSPRA